jgi:hypothetical protein
MLLIEWLLTSILEASPLAGLNLIERLLAGSSVTFVRYYRSAFETLEGDELRKRAQLR